MNVDKPIYRKIFKIVFFIVFTGLSVLHIKGYFKLDGISLALIIVSLSPTLIPYINKEILPYLNTNFKSIELFGVKAELLERKLEKQDFEIKKQEQIIYELVIYSMAFYLYEMLKDFDKCEKREMQEYIFRKSITFEHNLRYLRDNGYIEMTFKIASLADGENIAEKVKLTPIGRFYIALRGNYIAKINT